jgi:hypothetical protein
MALRLRRGTESERQNLVSPLLEGELIYVTDTGKLFVGDGTATGGVEVIGSGGGGGGATTLAALTDTDLTGFTDGDILTYIGASNKWEPVPTPGVSPISMNQLSDVDFSTVNALDILIYDGFNFVTVPVQTIFAEQQNWRVNIVGDDSTILVDTDTNSFRGLLFGNVEGNVTGDVQGSVFGDDSTLIIDGVSNSIIGNTVSTNQLNATGSNTGSDDKDLRIFAQGMNIIGYNGTLEEPTALSPGDTVGYFSFASTYDNSGANKLAAATVASWDATADLSTGAPRASLKFAIGNNSEDANIVATLDYIGNFSANVITPGTYADSAARDAAITTPTAGMMVFVTDVAKFQGYDGSAWVNLN